LFGQSWPGFAENIQVSQEGSQAPDGSISKSVSIEAVEGTAVNARFEGGASLKVLTYNTHLFGNAPAIKIDYFKDPARALAIADKIIAADVDVSGLQEVWDPELASAIINKVANTYPYSYYSNYIEDEHFIPPINSGLLLLSKHPLLTKSYSFPTPIDIPFENEVSILGCQTCLGACFGGTGLACALAPGVGCALMPVCFACTSECIRTIDGFATKGRLAAIIEKDGYTFGIIVTHLQAREGAEYEEIRAKQMGEIRETIQALKSTVPYAEIIVMGDLNTNGDPDGINHQDYNALLTISGLHDAYRNTPAFDTDESPLTTKKTNFRDMFGSGPGGQLLDYVLYSSGSSFELVPVAGEIKDFKTLEPYGFDDDGNAISNLSDHSAVYIEFLAQ